MLQAQQIHQTNSLILQEKFKFYQYLLVHFLSLTAQQ